MLSCHFWRVDFSIQLIKWLFQKVLSEKTTLFVIDIQSSYKDLHCIKKVRIRSFSDPHFSRIFSHSDRISPYSVQMRENQGKVRTRITLNTDSFYAALLFDKVLPFGNFWQCGRLIFFLHFYTEVCFLLIIYFLVFHSDRDSIKKGYFEDKITLCLHFSNLIL